MSTNYLYFSSESHPNDSMWSRVIEYQEEKHDINQKEKKTKEDLSIEETHASIVTQKETLSSVFSFLVVSLPVFVAHFLPFSVNLAIV